MVSVPVQFPWILLLAAALPGWLGAAELPIPGPVRAQVERVIDGDTVDVRADAWPGVQVVTKVRARGMNAPEIRSAKCPEERARGEAARNVLAGLVAGKTVLLYEITNDKFGGRVDAVIKTLDGQDVGEVLLAKGLAAPYDGGRRQSVCLRP